MDGTVTIALKDFKALELNAENGIKAVKIVKELDTEVFWFLEFLGRTNDMEKIAEVYNNQPGRLRILKLTPEGWRLAKKDSQQESN